MSSPMKSRRSSKKTPHQPSALVPYQRDGTTWNVESMAMPFRPPLRDHTPHRFLLSTEYVAWTSTSTAARSDNAIAVQLNGFAQYASFQALFDQYRIELIEMFLNPVGTTSLELVGSIGNAVSVIDYDDSNTLSSTDAYLAYENAVVTPVAHGHYRRFVPHVANAVYQGAFTAFGNLTSPWLDAAYPAVAHYGLKMGFEATSAVFTIDLFVRATVSFRNVR